MTEDQLEQEALSWLVDNALEAIEDQEMLQATAILGKALAGEVPRDPDGNIPIEYSAALELLRATRWKQRSGGHKQFGAS